MRLKAKAQQAVMAGLAVMAANLWLQPWANPAPEMRRERILSGSR